MRRPIAAIAALLVGLVASCSCTSSAPSSSSLVFGPDHLPAARVGQPYRGTISVSGTRTPVFTMKVVAGHLPPGIALAYARGASRATLGGTPTRSGQFSFTVQATCLGTQETGQTGTKTYQLTVEGG